MVTRQALDLILMHQFTPWMVSLSKIDHRPRPFGNWVISCFLGLSLYLNQYNISHSDKIAAPDTPDTKTNISDL